MAITKEIYIANRRIGLGTSVKGSEEVKRSNTQTFDGPRNSGIQDIPHTLEIGKLQCDTIDDYIAFSKLMKDMRTEKKTITIAETVTNINNDQFTVLKHYLGCLVDGKEFEMNAEDMTAETLKFAAEDMKEEFER